MVKRKAFILHVDIYVHVVTCPGTWLSNSGLVTLKVRTLGLSAMTSTAKPVFPLSFHEKLIFKKIISCVSTFAELQEVINQESLSVDLLQWPRYSEEPKSLAIFQTKLSHLLFPSPLEKGLTAGVDVDLLMHPTKIFPGVLGPKIQVSTKTSVEETTSSQPSCSGVGMLNRKTIRSEDQEKKSPTDPPSKLKSACSCESSACKQTRVKSPKAHKQRKKITILCPCKKSESRNCKNCEICLNYSGIFGVDSPNQNQRFSCCRGGHPSREEHLEEKTKHRKKQCELLAPILVTSHGSGDHRCQVPYNYQEKFYKKLQQFYMELQLSNKRRNLYR